MRKVWRFPNNSHQTHLFVHRAHLVSLNSDSHAVDMIYWSFCKMVCKLKTKEKNNKNEIDSVKYFR